MKKTPLIRVLLALGSQIDRYYGKSERTETNHDRNERILSDWTRRLGQFTIIIALISLFGLGISYLTLQDAQKATSLGNQAWIAPLSASFTGPVLINTPAEYEVTYDNVGRSPATDLAFDFFSGSVPMPDLERGELPNIPMNTTCAGLNSVAGADIIYPEQEGHYEVYKQLKGSAINAALLQGKRMEYFQGCFADKTLGEVHHSPWCFFCDPLGVAA